MPVKTTTKQQESLKAALAQAVISSILHGTGRTFSLSEVEYDGRKHAPLIKWAIEEGFAESADPHHVTALDEAFETFPSERPPLAARWHQSGIRGLVFGKLPVGEQKYIIQNKSDYQMFTVNLALYNGRPDEETTNARIFDEGFRWDDLDVASYEAAEKAWHAKFGGGTAVYFRAVVAMDPALLDFIVSHVRDVKIRHLMRLNVGYMLAKLGILTDEEAEEVGVRDDRTRNPFHKPFYLTLSPNSSEWPKQIGPKLDGALQEIERLTGVVKVLRKLQAADWGAVTAGLKKLAVEYIDHPED